MPKPRWVRLATPAATACVPRRSIQRRLRRAYGPSVGDNQAAGPM
jgi:hypothetical protein